MALTTTTKTPPQTNQVASAVATRVLVGFCSVVWLWSGWQPNDFSTWLIEQVATALALLALWWLCQSTGLSLVSKICIALLFCIHTLGTHYTYSLTPYDAFLERLTGSSLNGLLGWERNHYDRFVHLCFGLLLAWPLIEVLRDQLSVGRRAATFWMINIVLSSSALYELMEWRAAVMFGGELGTAYLGTQGDPWDAQADMAWALAGAMMTGLIAALAYKFKH